MSEAELIVQWYDRAKIDYTHSYMSLYASFNAWYRLITGSQNDREALNILRDGNTVWDEYARGLRMYELTYYMKLLVECTQREPISHLTPHWNGEVSHIRDWQSLIEYWYRVRCLVMHGVYIENKYVYLAYKTLQIFMGEIIQDLQAMRVFTNR